jgi:hypothetical protein
MKSDDELRAIVAGWANLSNPDPTDEQLQELLDGLTTEEKDRLWEMLRQQHYKSARKLAYLDQSRAAFRDRRRDELRIAIRFARWEHAQRALELMEEGDDEAGAADLRREMELLRPYWNRPGVTKEQAVEAYYRDYPEDRPKS